MTVRVLIVDDSAMMRSFLRESLAEHPGIEVVGTAPDPFMARQKIKLLNPDVVTLDIEMPGMDGLTFLEHLMRLRPMPVVMVSSQTQNGAAATLRALDIGAADFVAKPNSGHEQAWPEFRAEVTAKVLSAAASKAPMLYNDPPPAVLAVKSKTHRLIAIGGSTGSISVVQHIVTAMPADGPPIVIAVHMPALFTRQFAERMDGLSAMQVREASDGAPLRAGHAYLAPGDRHLAVVCKGRDLLCMTEPGPRVNGHVPSVDVLFESVALRAGEDAVGILLSGMGRDGAMGLLAMREAGAVTCCQDEASSVVYGMPGAAVALGAVERELDAKAIPAFALASAVAQKPKLDRTAG